MIVATAQWNCTVASVTLWLLPLLTCCRVRSFSAEVLCTYAISLPAVALNLYAARTWALPTIFTAHKRSLGQGNVFTGVCLFMGVGDERGVW